MPRGTVSLKKALEEMRKDKPDLKLAFELLNKSANARNAEALYAIGTWYLHGRFVKQAPGLAVDYFLKSIQENYAPAYYDLAVCYEKGVGSKKNPKRAFECYLNAALFGEKQSLYEVGRCFYYGIGISKNLAVAAVWLEHAKINGIVYE